MCNRAHDPDDFTVRFVAGTVWYPEIAQVLSPQIPVDWLFFDRLGDG